MSPDGRFIVFRETYGHACGSCGIFRLDRRRHGLRLVSRRSDGSPYCLLQTPVGMSGRLSGGTVSADGRVVAFQQRNLQSDGSPAPTLLVRAGSRTRTIDGFAHGWDTTPDGRYVVCSNFVDGGAEADLFRRDRVGRSTVQLTGTPNQVPPGRSQPALISDGGRPVAFCSTAPDLVGGDRNGVTDVFLRDVGSQTTSRLSLAVGGGEPRRASLRPAISADGRFVAFDSTARPARRRRREPPP
jgi:Tol biopolymer transport system component